MSKYFKFSSGASTEDIHLVYVHDSLEDDNNYIIRNMLQLSHQQPVETRKEMSEFFEMDFWKSGNVKTINKKFESVIFVGYIFNKATDAYKIKFDFNNNKLQINNKIYNINGNTKDDFKVLKNKINCHGGIDKVYNIIVNSLNPNYCFHSSLNLIFKKISQL